MRGPLIPRHATLDPDGAGYSWHEDGANIHVPYIPWYYQLVLILGYLGMTLLACVFLIGPTLVPGLYRYFGRGIPGVISATSFIVIYYGFAGMAIRACIANEPGWWIPTLFVSLPTLSVLVGLAAEEWRHHRRTGSFSPWRPVG